MAIADIRLQNFRSYSDASFEFEPGVNIVVGPNASGKTNLLEALLIVAEGSSYRAADHDLIAFDKPWARLDAQTSSGERVVKLQNNGLRALKSYVLDDKPFKRLTHAHTLPLVLFEPNHLQLLGGQPDARRNYLDEILERLQPGYSTQRRHYRRVLSQRNSLLKSHTSRQKLEADLFVWNIRLSELGGVIARARAGLVDQIASQIEDIYGSISHSITKVTAAYVSKLPIGHYETALLHQLESHLDSDIARGYTSYGPHRDDFAVLFNSHTAAEAASRGETRSALLALKIIELKLTESVRSPSPILLLDDVFSELDGKRRRALTSFLSPYQTFITTTDADVVVQHFMEDCRIIAL